MRNAKRSAAIGIIMSIAGIWITATFVSGQTRSLAELYKTGKIRFVPEITITDTAMGGKDYFVAPADLALDDRGNIFVSDSRANNIKIFDSDGKYLKTIGKAGQGPGDFNYPAEIEFAGGRFFVRELMNGRISILDREGAFIKSVPILEVGTGWWNIAGLPDGRFIVEKEKSNIQNPGQPQECRIELYSSEFEFTKPVYTQKIWRNRYIRDQNATKNVPVPFSSQVYWSPMSDGKIVIGYSEKYDVEIYDPDRGKIGSFSHAYHPAEVTSDDKELYFKGMGFTFSSSSGASTTQRGAPDYILKLTEFPKFKPAYNFIRIDPENNIWIRPWSTKQIGPASFDAFRPDGTFIGAVEIAKDSRLPNRIVRQGSCFWGITVDKDGEYTIAKMRIEAAK